MSTIQKMYVGNNQVRPVPEQIYEANLSEFTILTTKRGGNAVIQDGYVTSTYQGGIIYKDISNILDLSSANYIILEREHYYRSQTWSNNCRVFIQDHASNNTTSGSTIFGSLLPTQSSSGYTKHNVMVVNSSGYISTDTGAWWTSSAWNTIKCVFDIANGTLSYSVNGVVKGTASASGMDVIKSATTKFLNIYVETNNRIRNVKITVK